MMWGHTGPQRRGQLAEGGGNIRSEMENVGSVTSTLSACQVLMLDLVGGEAPEGL